MNNIKDLLEFPIQLTITGKTSSGKSFLLRKRILPEIIGEYTGIYIFSPTSKLDKDWSNWYHSLSITNQDKVFLIDEVDLNSIEELFTMIGQNKLEGSNDKYLMIFDDTTNLYSRSNNSIFGNLSFKGRHSNISYIFTVHKYNIINTLIRSNVKTKIIFRTTNQHELKSFLEDNVTIETDRNTLEQLLMSCTGENKAFVIDSREQTDKYFCISKTGKLIEN